MYTNSGTVANEPVTVPFPWPAIPTQNSFPHVFSMASFTRSQFVLPLISVVSSMAAYKFDVTFSQRTFGTFSESTPYTTFPLLKGEPLSPGQPMLFLAEEEEPMA